MQESQESVLSPKEGHRVSIDQWTVGMLRKPDSENPHHVLLIVEGRNSFGQALLRRYDLYIDEKRSPDPVTHCQYSKIAIRPEVFCASQDAKVSLETLINAERYYVKAWSVSAEKARELHDNILQTKQNPPLYLESGNESIFEFIKRSKTVNGHSCYTWARAELKKIGLDVPKSLLDTIIAVPDLIITPENPSLERGTGCRIQ